METKHSYQEALAVLTAFCSHENNLHITNQVIAGITRTLSAGGKILICGNGGSACDAMHFAEELTGQYRDYRKALPAIALTDSAHITCVANDFGFNKVFARGVEAYGKPGDWLIALSTSGNSENIIEAINCAKQLDIKTLALLGKNGGKIKSMCDYELIVNAETSDRIQEVHMTILHIIIEGIERTLFPENYN